MALIKYKDPVTGQWVPVVGASKEYIDAGDDKRVLRAGDTMTGPLVLPGNATTNLQAVPKQQLDAAVSRIDGNVTALAASLASFAAVAEGSWSAGAAGLTTVNLTNLVFTSLGGFTLANGYLKTWADGTYLLHFYARVSGGTHNDIWIGTSINDSLRVALTSGTMSSLHGGPPPLIRQYAAGETLPRPLVNTSGAGHSGLARLTAIRIDS